MSSSAVTVWVVGIVMTAVLATFVAVAAVCFYRRNAVHERRKQLCLQNMRKNVAAGNRGGITSGPRKKNGRAVMSASRLSPSAPPSPAAAAIPVLVAGPHHYYTDPTKYTFDSFYAATTSLSAQEEAAELSNLSSSG